MEIVTRAMDLRPSRQVLIVIISAIFDGIFGVDRKRVGNTPCANLFRFLPQKPGCELKGASTDPLVFGEQQQTAITPE